MDTLITSLFICLAIPMLLSLVLVEKKGAPRAGFYARRRHDLLLHIRYKRIFYPFEHYQYSYVTGTLTPIVEELIKALPVLLFACLYSDDRKQLLTAAAVGLGFAIMENVYIMANNPDSINIAFAAVRTLGAGLMHSLCTVAVGYGISFVRKKKKLFFTGTFALLAAAITYHGVYNMLVQSDYSYMGPVLAFLLGLTFSFAWASPFEPFSGSGALMADTAKFAGLIAVYILGFGIPFLIVDFFATELLGQVKAKHNAIKYTAKIAAVVVILIGVITLTGLTNQIAGYFST